MAEYLIGVAGYKNFSTWFKWIIGQNKRGDWCFTLVLSFPDPSDERPNKCYVGRGYDTKEAAKAAMQEFIGQLNHRYGCTNRRLDDHE